MRISQPNIKELQSILMKQNDLNLTEEEAQEAGIAIIRLILAKNFALNGRIKDEQYGNGKYMKMSGTNVSRTSKRNR